MAQWADYLADKDPARHRITGDLQIQYSVHSPELGNARDVSVWLPPSYAASSKRYPVIYMHDGQNLFDAATSYAGEWNVDETMQHLAGEGKQAIVVGLPNTPDRMREYFPFSHPYFGDGCGDDYLRFIFDTVKPQIDGAFPTKPDKANTGMAGSSLGGLITLYAYFKPDSRIGFAAALSPSLWIARGAIHQLADRGKRAGRLYYDIGTSEYKPNPRWGNVDPLADYRNLGETLSRRGYREGADWMYVEESGGQHNEGAWARRFPTAARFLLG